MDCQQSTMRLIASDRQAACAGVGTETFIVGRGDSYDAARTLCAVCPVRQPCLETALQNPDLAGMWSGTTERQRQSIRLSKSVYEPEPGAIWKGEIIDDEDELKRRERRREPHALWD